MSLAQRLSLELSELDKKGQRRQLRVIEEIKETQIRLSGCKLCNFSSNDYLGLSTHPALREAALEAMTRFGNGATASRLICGTSKEHALLEEELAVAKKTEAALVFSTGYAASTGAIPALMRKEDVIILDKLAHASLIDGARASNAILRVFRHNDLQQLEEQLIWARKKFPHSEIMIITESIFSMDGDAAPLKEVVALKEKYGALLFLDEAHALGVRGKKEGRMGGLAGELGLNDRIDIQMGSLGKAVGVSGGYLCASRLLIDYLINRTRSFIYSTAPTPAVAAAARTAIKIINSTEGEKLADRLWKNITQLTHSLSSLFESTASTSTFNFTCCEAASAILPLILGKETTALAAAEQLLEGGFFVPAIRYPTVARGKARLRITLSANHTFEEIDLFAQKIRSYTTRKNIF
ncbi:MAG: aminotransferase class I/II-fold pyridoxal phosphate-dependent enzyme [Chthoniobacterales bacterium]